jgi:hypothetical protein
MLSCILYSAHPFKLNATSERYADMKTLEQLKRYLTCMLTADGLPH